MTDQGEPLGDLKRVLLGDHLDEASAGRLMAAIMDGKATDAQIGALLGALRIRSPTTEELAGFAEAMRSASRDIGDMPGTLVDTAGTGGAVVKSFNVSTTAGFVIAAAGLPVAKHGNRSVTSPSGSADVLEALGANIEQSPEGVKRTLEKAGFTFLFAPSFHPAMKHAIGPRRELGVPTVFNMLGPLTNPAKPTHQLVGVGRPELVPTIAETMRLVGIEGAVVHGSPGFDEVSIAGPTTVAYVKEDEVTTGHITPKDLGVDSADVSEVRGVPPENAAKLVREILDHGEGPRAEMVIANAGLTIYAAGAAEDPAEGVDKARQAMDDGSALKVLEAYVQASNEA